jgi:hypothetical protein
MTVHFFTLILLLLQANLPYKPSDEFQLDLDYAFKQRPVGSSNTILFGQGEKKTSNTGPLPYLIINLKVLKLGDTESRVKAVDGTGRILFSKKTEVGAIHKLDLGYTDDIKDRVTAYEFEIFFLTSSKKPVSHIHLFVKEDGEFLVNGEKRGKF